MTTHTTESGSEPALTTAERSYAPSQRPSAADLAPALEYLDKAAEVLQRVRETQLPSIAEAARLCADCIARRGLVHLFGTGHSRMAIEEVFPRYGSFPGFHPMVELSLTNHTQVVGSNGQRQAMFLERQEGFGEVILRNFVFRDYDVMIVFSTSGTNAVVVDVALGAKARDMKLIVVIAEQYSRLLPSAHSCGKKLSDLADLVIDNCAPPGDAVVTIPGIDVPVGPVSTIGNTAVVNALKCLVAADLARRGKPPLVLAGAQVMGAKASLQRFEDTYDDYRDRLKVAYGG